MSRQLAQGIILRGVPADKDDRQGGHRYSVALLNAVGQSTGQWLMRDEAQSSAFAATASRGAYVLALSVESWIGRSMPTERELARLPVNVPEGVIEVAWRGDALEVTGGTATPEIQSAPPPADLPSDLAVCVARAEATAAARYRAGEPVPAFPESSSFALVYTGRVGRPSPPGMSPLRWIATWSEPERRVFCEAMDREVVRRLPTAGMPRWVLWAAGGAVVASASLVAWSILRARKPSDEPRQNPRQRRRHTRRTR